ncbi:hypothetical protein CRYUN_Cryun12cG0027700 [Craigia yunnanensis]
MSASDRNSNVPRGGVLHPAKKEQSELHASPLSLSTRAYRTRSPLHDKNTSLNQRVSLGKDIELLQLCLQQEKSMRIMLERAMGRASSTLSPGHRHFAAQTKELIADIELLEEEVTNREQHASITSFNFISSTPSIRFVPHRPAAKPAISFKHVQLLSTEPLDKSGFISNLTCFSPNL